MCGIAGFETRGDDFDALAGSLLDSLGSRGPDGRFRRETSGYGLVQTRLAVIDLSDRVQYPMPNENEDLWLIFNGEIYGHTAIQSELESLGHRFRTDCDAEVVVHGFEQWGLDVFKRLNGMYALALVDERKREITLARDATGIKPLVRTTGGRFAFASDAMALVSAGLSRGEVDERAISEYGAFHYVPPPLTGISDVVQVEPGTAITRSRDGSESTVRWSPVYFDAPAPDSPVSMEELNQALLDSMSRQLVADVEVGVFLSGGVDSSLIAALAVELGAKPRAFTVAFDGHGDYDETARAAQLAKALGIPHHVKSMNVGFTEAVEGVGTAYDQPFADSSAIPMLALSRFARSEVTVALSGTGGDDLFAGYYRHRAHRLLRAVSLLPDRLTTKLAEAPIQRGAERGSASTLARSYLARIAKAGTGDVYSQYLSLVGGMTPEAGLNPPPGEKPPIEVREEVADRLGLRNPGSGSILRELQRFELQSYLPGDLLTKEDRASMAFGLEARVPLLDAEVISLAQRVPDRQKVSLLGGKLLLRKLAREKLPANKRSGRKRGFAVPLRDFFAGPWHDEAREWLSECDSTLIDGPATARMLDAEHSKATDIWTLSALAAWEQRLDSCRRVGGSGSPRPRCSR
jgi:asparagine synthase (glutamine-hydrolysing)